MGHASAVLDVIGNGIITGTERNKIEMAEWRDKEAICECGHKAVEHGRRSRTCKIAKCPCIRFQEQKDKITNIEYLLGIDRMSRQYL